MTKEDLGHLIIASTDSLYRISKSILRNETDCEDAVSEAIVKSFDKINTLQHASYAKTWLVRILINECYRIYRQKQFAPSNDFTFKENLSDEADYSELYHAMMQLTISIESLSNYIILRATKSMKLQIFSTAAKAPSKANWPAADSN